MTLIHWGFRFMALGLEFVSDGPGRSDGSDPALTARDVQRCMAVQELKW